ncbi:hypothetical protein F5Y15DRAFT_65953 [Xylariaceae sp. FL0016]|nr:hypothetical protein F5Y15DRAFT_65953 [Xylariaceae sp. FL0016]
MSANAAAWTTSAGIWATLGYTIIDKHGGKVARFFMRAKTQYPDSVSNPDLEAGRQRLNSSMQASGISLSTSEIEAQKLQMLKKAQNGLIPLPAITEDEMDFFLAEYKLAN